MLNYLQESEFVQTHVIFISSYTQNTSKSYVNSKQTFDCMQIYIVLPFFAKFTIQMNVKSLKQ